MKLKWYGHACFKLDFSNGPYVVADPFDESVGYPLCDAYADVVTTSHEHFDHNYISSIKGNPTRLNRPGMFTFDDLVVEGVKSYHDDMNGAKRGDNIIFIFESDKLRIAHMGDLGHMPDNKQLAALTDIDVMLIPIGGHFTIDAETAARVMERVKPRVTIPMHYKTEAINFPIADEKQFVKLTDAKYFDSNEIEITRENIDSLPREIVLKHPARN